VSGAFADDDSGVPDPAEHALEYGVASNVDDP
jgi:hypothetical protein